MRTRRKKEKGVTRVKEFREMFPESKIYYYDVHGKDITYKPQIILDCMAVIGSGFLADGTIHVDVLYEE